jgi:hypothetical protein
MADSAQISVEQAVARGSVYIINSQSADGAWTEWNLPPGRSRAWATAFVGYRTRLVPAAQQPGLATARAAASEWLIAHQFDGGGWGYNEWVCADADSTALGILFLASLGIEAPESSYTRLRQLQRVDGGFATYDEPGSWGAPHPDVTPIAVLALLTKDARSSPCVERGLEYVRRQRDDESGLWHSFWWTSPAYATEGSVRLLTTAESSFDRRRTRDGLLDFVPQNAFEAGLRLSALLHLDHAIGDAVDPLIGDMLRRQRSDGSFPSAPVLRVTRRDCAEPWSADDAGEVFQDDGCLFATSVAVECLAGASMRRPILPPTPM